MDTDLASIQTLIDKLIEFSVEYSFQVVGAVIILIVGTMIGKWVAKIIAKLCDKANLDVTLSKFLASVGKVLVIAFTLIIALGKFGIHLLPLSVPQHSELHTRSRGPSQTMARGFRSFSAGLLW